MAKKLSGFGGLFIFPLLHLIFGILADSVDTITFLSENMAIFGVLFMMSALYGVYVFYLMTEKRKKFINLAIIYYWIPIILSVIVLLIMLMNIEFIESVSYENMIQNIVYIGPALLWSLYLKKSKRVKNTFKK